MYIGVDVGGTKTLVAVLDAHGKIIEKTKFATPITYDHFLLELKHLRPHLKHKDFKAGGIAMPGLIDRKHGRAIAFGNLPWKNCNVQYDTEKIFACPIVVENDAKLAALSEALLHKDKETVLYVTVSTGIGTAVVHEQRLANVLLNMEGGHMSLPHRGKLKSWEDFASGRAIVEQFGKKASDIPADDKDSWKQIAHNLGLGLFELIAITQPNLIVIGGSIGTYFNRYSEFLVAELKKHELPIVPIPQVVAAERPEEAVVYGCYDLARQTFNHG
jgi:predicted NBD/HSP70 family sugar kinase